MCGIAGCFGSADAEIVRRMMEALRHRGPDDAGVWSNAEAGVALGHTRLSIIDCSAAGRQPMTSADGRLTVVFNGEIFNYRELRLELAALGYRFSSQSDTAVLLAAYRQWGPQCVTRLTGMFAFALFDLSPEENSPSFVLARDRLGIKPLLYLEEPQRLWFASELRALELTPACGRGIDREAVLDYLAVGSVFQPRTILRDVKALPPGTRMEVRGRDRRIVRYWDLHESTAQLRRELQSITEPDATALLRELLNEATRRNLVADVPVGAFLSGGIDSTAIVGLATRIGGNPVHTFSVGFESPATVADERPMARLAARHHSSQHEEIVIGHSQARELFEAAISAIDQPSIDGLNTWIVARATAGSLKVALSGLGGDELFAGYPHFAWLAESNDRRSKSRGLIGRALETAMRIRPNTPSFRLLLRRAGPAGRLAMLRRLLADHELGAAVQDEWSAGFRERLEHRHASWIREDADPVQQTTYGEVRGYLVSTLLRDGDVMSMAHGLEVRPALLHHPLAEFAYALPARLKLGGRPAKTLFLRAVGDLVPNIIARRRKTGFELPFVEWMAGPLCDRIDSQLSTRNARRLFRQGYLTTIRRRLRHGTAPRALWAWAILLAWLEITGHELG
jgi:asparagine synthase (glutamine-hydrolysing)